MYSRITRSGLRIDERLFHLVRDEITPGTGIDPDAFWASLAAIVRDLAPLNRTLLEQRNDLQQRIDQWCSKGFQADEQREFLEEIGYLEPETDDYAVATADVDPEIASMPGPQLVVPIDNARYALNAANARWGSLYDALYGTNVIPEAEGLEKGTEYNPARGEAVVAWAEQFLDKAFPLLKGSHRNVHNYLLGWGGDTAALEAVLEDGESTSLADPTQFKGSTTACTWNCTSTGHTPSANCTGQAYGMLCSSLRSPPSRTWRIRWPPWTARTRSRSTATGPAS